MSAVKDAFATARESVDWANDAIGEFNRAAASFFNGGNAEIITELDTQTGEHVQKLRLKLSLPKDLRRKATEALTTTKHAFDQATYAARNLTSGMSKRSIYYPWSSNPTDLQRLLKERGIDQRLWDVFAAHQPYPAGEGYAGGNDLARTLARIANDKHTVGLAADAFIQSTGFPAIHGKTVQSLKVLSPHWDPKKNEAELVRWIGDVEIEGNYRIGFQVIFQDARFPKPVGVGFALAEFAKFSQLVIESLEVRCLDLQSHAAAP